MSHFVGFFLLLVCLVEIASPLVKKDLRKDYLFSKNKESVLYSVIMPPSTNLTTLQKYRMVHNCKKVFEACNYAEECCSAQCAKHYKRCIHFWG